MTFRTIKSIFVSSAGR